jgi:hypothetical protein
VQHLAHRAPQAAARADRVPPPLGCARCRHHLAVAVLALLFTGWSAITAAKVLARLAPALQRMKSLVAYPCFLMYAAFALLTSY